SSLSHLPTRAVCAYSALTTCHFARSFVLFFILRPRPPRCSTLFPYTPLFRSLVAVRGAVDSVAVEDAALERQRPGGVPQRRRNRSEEHTSELQSRFDLVCRLLLEKKKDIRRYRRCMGSELVRVRVRYADWVIR